MGLVGCLEIQVPDWTFSSLLIRMPWGTYGLSELMGAQEIVKWHLHLSNIASVFNSQRSVISAMDHTCLFPLGTGIRSAGVHLLRFRIVCHQLLNSQQSH